jgi:hypothetical protein
MSKRKLIAIGLVLVLAVIGVSLFSSLSPPQVVGTLAPNDLTEILRLVRHDLREHLLPKVEWDNLFYPRYVVSSIREYRAQRILWVEVHDDGRVEVFAGVSRDVIRDEGHVWSLRKTQEWSITGYAYWASSNVAPAGIHVPPSSPNQGAAANRRPAGQSDGSGNLSAPLAADRAFPAAVAELER